MADVGRMSVQELVGKVLADEHADVLRQAVVWLAQELMEAEVSRAAGAAYGERSGERVARRNGYRERGWDTRVGSVELAIPRLRSGSYFPSFLEPRRRSEQALVAVVQEAYVNGVSTRKVDRLVEALGLAGVSKTPSRGCAVGWTSRSWPFASGRWRAPIPIYGWMPRSRRSAPVGGSSIGPWWWPTGWTPAVSGRSSAWTWARPRPRRSGGSSCARWSAAASPGVQLVVSDAHEGLKQAIAQVLSAPWQRCTVHFLRDALGHCPKDLQQLVGAAIRPIFRAACLEDARRLLGETVAHLQERVPKVARLLEEAETDLLAFYSFPAAHRSKLRSTNPLERVKREIGRRTDVVGVFPNDQALIRLAGSLLIEQNNEWLVSRRYLSEASMAELTTNPTTTTGKELQVA